MILRARNVLPITAPPIENGAVVISGNQIRAAGSWSNLKSECSSEEIFDLGEVVLLPGLVNAHCHLDYTDMAGLWSAPKKFTDWIPQMLAAKAAWSYTDYARSWLNGAKMLLQTGTTTVADIEAVPELLPEMWDATPLRIFSFLEMTGIRSKRGPRDILNEAISKMDSLSHPRCAASLSPHAPYSTSPELLRLCAKIAREKQLRITMHVAESAQEFEMFAQARGGMFDWLKKNQRDNSDCGLGTPVEHLERAGLLGENLLAVHANYLGEKDFNLLAKRNVSVAHCPRSHDYFRHEPFPLKKLLDANVNVCLGTDSLSTTRKNGKQKPELNLFAEMRALAANDESILPEEILKMATVNGAHALGLAGKTGELSENAFADLITIPFTGKVADIYEAVLHHASTVSVSMVDGQWAIAP
ncbi:MAG TPA: amidohydrolase family protein [Methylomirabilota bacterium]|nr:amidohydrolase family protein [Methylomirabilota bacterium]